MCELEVAPILIASMDSLAMTSTILISLPKTVSKQMATSIKNTIKKCIECSLNLILLVTDNATYKVSLLFVIFSFNMFHECYYNEAANLTDQIQFP